MAIPALWLVRHETTLAATVVTTAGVLLSEHLADVTPLVVGTLLVVALVPAGSPWTDVARWIALLPLAVAITRPRRLPAVAVASAAALTVAFVSADAIRGPQRDATAAVWSLERRVRGSARVFATDHLARVLRVAAPGSMILPWDDALAAHGGLPEGFTEADVAICDANCPFDERQSRPDLVAERQGAARILRLVRR